MATSASRLRRGADRFVQALGRFISRVWFRSIEVEGMETIEAGRPVLVCANHANGFVDPVLLVSTSPRPVRFLAKSTLWKVPGLGALLGLCGALPVYRRRDGSTDSNKDTFSACFAELRDDGVIGIFPEGTVNDTLKLLPLKTGAARIALGAREEGAHGLRIVPVGLLYEDKARPRGRVLVRAGPPLDLDDHLGEVAPPGRTDDSDDRVAVDRLTELIRRELDVVYADYDDEAERRLLSAAAAVRLRPPESDPSRQVPLAISEPLARRLAALPPDARQPVVDAINTYQGQLDLLGLRDADVVPGNTLSRLRNGLNQSATKAVLLAPLAALGAGLNAVPFAAMKFVATRPMPRISRANTTMLAAIVSFPAAWLGWAVLGRRRLRHPWVLAFLAGPLCGEAAVLCWEEVARLRRARIHWERLRSASGLIDELRDRRVAVVRAVDGALMPEPAPRATPLVPTPP
jgi:1-acyl-sn-glycerol-3-phosphate acyltransferase